ncbi:lipoyl synthase [Thermogymnomonas acidicola]|uniref:Lipoyl synthase n=1 Tax=Thermogymnomonas acidicola TaxID=399579 RepID=A0AA37BQP4_9ARCH|nr:lipoyl synthase [Thermogymnomonas acidicola]GGM68700.1 lipoyl synthase [Thermogymnomonas acidicola]
MKPEYAKVYIPGGENYAHIKKTLRSRALFTVCEEARCPNIAECWDSGTATFMIMGGICTRGCRFCSVTHGHPMPLDPDEPRKVYESVIAMGLDYVVITSVDRDDLPDQGASHFASVIREVKKTGAVVEVLIPDFQGREDLLDIVIDAQPSVIAHNIETVERLTPSVRDRRASYRQSLHVLRYIKERSGITTKSSIMLGLGETDEEVERALDDLRQAGVDIVTIGQYLRPSRRQMPVVEYSSMERFRKMERVAYSKGFSYVASGPLVRSSYRAAEAWVSRRY